MSIKKYVVLTFGAISLISIITSFYNKTKIQQKQEPELVVGTALGYAPWVSTNEHGQYEGFDIDVIKEVAERMQRKLVIKDLGSMAHLFMALEQGSIDVIIWGMSIIEDRLKRVDMVRYHGEATTSYPLLFWENIPPEVQSIEDMKGMKVCVEPASSQENALKKYDFLTKIPVEKVDDGLLNIQFKKADAALVEPAIAKKFMSKYPQIKKIDLPLDKENIVQGVGICISKSNHQIKDKISNIIDKLNEEKIIAKLATKWNIE